MAPKLCQSSSISGPSATAKPRRLKIETIWLRTRFKGWRVPTAIGSPGRDKSMAAAPAPAPPVAFSLRVSNLVSTKILNSFRIWPNSFFWSTGTFFISPMMALTKPFVPSHLILNASTKSAVPATSAATSSLNPAIFCNKASMLRR